MTDLTPEKASVRWCWSWMTAAFAVIGIAVADDFETTVVFLLAAILSAILRATTIMQETRR